MLTREKLLEKMREDYKNGDVRSLKSKYYLSAFLLTNEDKKKISLAIVKLEGGPLSVKEALTQFDG